MNCSYCPKRRRCSGGACYYEDRPEPSQKRIDDIALEEAVRDGRAALWLYKHHRVPDPSEREFY